MGVATDELMNIQLYEHHILYITAHKEATGA